MGLKVNAVSAGENKLDYADFKPLSEEARERLQANVNKWHERFQAEINNKRTVPQSSMTGQTYEGMEAVEAGLADGVVNDLNEVIGLMANL
jgi:ClpP class serine protease